VGGTHVSIGGSRWVLLVVQIGTYLYGSDVEKLNKKLKIYLPLATAAVSTQPFAPNNWPCRRGPTSVDMIPWIATAVQHKSLQLLSKAACWSGAQHGHTLQR
jgi:hypothetical protein